MTENVSTKSTASPTYPVLLQEFPWRNPIQLVEAIEDIVRDKSICDIGCGAGDLMAYMLQLGAKNVIGFENNQGLVQLALKHNRNYVTFADLWHYNIPKNADVYYMWTGDNLMNFIIDKIEKGKVIICGTSQHNPLENNENVKLIEKRSFQYDERLLCNDRYQKWEYNGVRNVWIFERI